ncbi:Hypothetical protein NTJ_03850 [Nesidiocoris tenuis]|uniref:Uncharacterized protein n=1 Tax=Nesidiocoris tenuis TaxID=355587 RepID=A0ABN7AKZ7_9HEMI|nr:Hypothetical protein NTJ_03850 [Nesidiocoris tenuis]
MIGLEPDDVGGSRQAIGRHLANTWTMEPPSDLRTLPEPTLCIQPDPYRKRLPTISDVEANVCSPEPPDQPSYTLGPFVTAFESGVRSVAPSN